MAKATSRFPASVAVVGFALLSLTPAAPAFLRNLDLVFVHLYRVFDIAVASAHRVARDESSASPERLDAETRRRIFDSVRRWDEALKAGAATFAPKLRTTIARVVGVDRARRRLLVDAGPGVSLLRGDPVLAGEVVVGRVTSAEDGVAVVETPWTPDARFAAACLGEGGAADVRFVAKGLPRAETLASVTNPERREGLRDGADVRVPDVRDLIPDSFATLPPGLRLGKLALDEQLVRLGAEETWLVKPVLDLDLLDAVAIAFEADRVHAPQPYFADSSPTSLGCGLASAWRDGRVLAGRGMVKGGAVVAGDRMVGTVEEAWFGAARVRGVFDPGRKLHVLIVGSGEAFPAELIVERRSHDSAQLRKIALPPGRNPERGDLLVSAGRGQHEPRALYLAEVLYSDAERIDVAAPRPDPAAETLVFRRSGFPSDPWRAGPAGDSEPAHGGG